MSLIKEEGQLSKLDMDKKFIYIEKFMQAVKGVVNGNLEFAKNMLISSKTVTFAQGGVDVKIDHGLGRIPRGYLVISRDTINHVYDGVSPATESFIYLRAQGTLTAKIVFL